jgi:Family of unknown function (DUF6084)
MTELLFECLDSRPQPYAAAPTLLFRLRVVATGSDGPATVHALALRCQLRIEPRRRRYSDEEAELLGEVFGTRSRFGDTLLPMEFAQVSVVLPQFTGSTEVDLPVPCTYDLEVGLGKYFHALREGVVPLALMFSGTLFGRGETGLWIEQVPWHSSAEHRMPVTVWQELVDTFYPGSSWLRLRRDTVDALLRYKSAHAVPDWDGVMTALLAAEREPSHDH